MQMKNHRNHKKERYWKEKILAISVALIVLTGLVVLIVNSLPDKKNIGLSVIQQMIAPKTSRCDETNVPLAALQIKSTGETCNLSRVTFDAVGDYQPSDIVTFSLYQNTKPGTDGAKYISSTGLSSNRVMFDNLRLEIPQSNSNIYIVCTVTVKPDLQKDFSVQLTQSKIEFN